MTFVCSGRGLHLLLVAGPPGDQLPLAPLPHLQLLALDGLLRPRYHNLNLRIYQKRIMSPITLFPGNMLVWLIDQLLEAEAAGEKVHILSHVPPGNAECLGAWGREYSRIITRFEKTITGQFHGHTHYDHFALHYDPDNSTRATGMGFISPRWIPITRDLPDSEYLNISVLQATQASALDTASTRWTLKASRWWTLRPGSWTCPPATREARIVTPCGTNCTLPGEGLVIIHIY